MSGKVSNAVYVTDYPLYGLDVTPGGLVVLAGGGGAAKTGVPNTLEVISVVDTPARRICSITQGDGAFANLAFHPRENVAAAGTDGVLKLFSLEGEGLGSNTTRTALSSLASSFPPPVASTGATVGGRRARRPSSLSSMAPLAPTLVPLGKQDTDFAAEDQFQRVVRFNSDGSRILTGGADGTIRIWEFPSLKRSLKIPLNAQQPASAPQPSSVSLLIQDLDFDHVGARVCVCAGTGLAWVFRAVDGGKEAALTWFSNNNLDEANVFKCCRFGLVQGKSVLFTAVNPTRSSSKVRKHSMIVSWDVGTWRELRHRAVSVEALCALVVSRDGSLVAAGDMEGSVFVHQASDLAPLQRVRAHGLFVTGLVFIRDPTSAAPASSPSAPTHILSISADRALVKTPVHASTRSSSLMVFLLFFITLSVVLLFFANSDWIAGGSSAQQPDVPKHHTEV